MLAAGEGERILLELIYDPAGNLTDEFFSFLRVDAIPVDELEALKRKADKLRLRRINAAKETRGKIGRNDQCPCGSGKKYKKCCISLMV